MSALGDGTYDVFVVDATDTSLDDGTPAVHLELTVLAGEHKGEVVALTATGLGRSELDLLGSPGTLVVQAGAPVFALDP